MNVPIATQYEHWLICLRISQKSMHFPHRCSARNYFELNHGAWSCSINASTIIGLYRCEPRVCNKCQYCSPAYLHASLISSVLKCAFKSRITAPTLVHNGVTPVTCRNITHCWSICYGSWYSRFGPSEMLIVWMYQCPMHWMSLTTETFWVNHCNRSGIPLTFNIKQYDFGILHAILACHCHLSADWLIHC